MESKSSAPAQPGQDDRSDSFTWPNRVRLAFSLVVNVEEGAEGRVADGDRNPEAVDELGISLRGDIRNLGNESNYQYGIDEGAPRILKLLSERQIVATFTSAALALERSPAIAQSIVSQGHEICAHGYRWVHQFKLSEPQEREFIRAAATSIETTTGQRPKGWLSRYLFTEHTRRLLVEEGYSYHMDDYSRDVPFWDETPAGPIVVVPYALDSNDMKMWTAPAYTPEQWLEYALETLDVLYKEGQQQPRMMSLGVHLRVIGRPGRIRMLERFVDRLLEYDDIWITTRSAIASHFAAETGSNSKRTEVKKSALQPIPDSSIDLPSDRTDGLIRRRSAVAAAGQEVFTPPDTRGLIDEFPIGEAFINRFRSISRDELYDQQNKSFLQVLERAWQIPFYQRLWSGAGIERGAIQHIDQIEDLPIFDKSDLMHSIEVAPPWGDYHGIEDFSVTDRMAVTMHTTSGTTGRPQVIPFGPRSRAVQNLLLARIYLLQGLAPEDVVQSVYGHGLVNGGHYIREAITQWTGARLLSAGTGLETSSERQLALMQEFDVTALVGFPDYLLKLAQLANESGLDENSFSIRMISGHLGNVSREMLSKAWQNAEVYDWYGVGDTGAIAGEGPDRDGLYVMEDAHYLELLDIDTSRRIESGQSGDMVVTCLFKNDVYPIIRFNTHDISSPLQGDSASGLKLQRIRGFLGRSDNMIKLRGINIFPDSIGIILHNEASATGEYLCRLVQDREGNESLLVMIEAGRRDENERQILSNLLRQRLGVGVEVELSAPGSLAQATGLNSRQKPIRFIDERRRDERSKD